VSPRQQLALALQADDGRPVERLEDALDGRERPLARAHAGRRRRHYALGRLAVAAALRRLLGHEAAVEAGPFGAPRVAAEGGDPVGVSIAHSARLAAACAWTCPAASGVVVGVDLERLRPSDVASSEYAFSRRERRLLRAAGGDPEAAGLAAWVAKESAWKALCLPPRAGPEAVELRAFRPEHGRAVVFAARGAARAVLSVGLTWLHRPDGVYVMALAHGSACGVMR
jgi:phosphopantetheinyl transferase